MESEFMRGRERGGGGGGGGATILEWRVGLSIASEHVYNRAFAPFRVRCVWGLLSLAPSVSLCLPPPPLSLSLSLSLSLRPTLATDRNVLVLNARTSSLSTLVYCIPQGSVLGPILFSLYINDLPLCIKTLCELFADDTSLHDHHTDLNTLHASLQYVRNLNDWTEMNHMALHPDKTKFMLISTRQKRQNIVSYFHPLTVQGITI